MGVNFLNSVERADAEEIGITIVETEDTEVTETLVREMSDADLLEWLAAWDNEWAIARLEEVV